VLTPLLASLAAEFAIIEYQPAAEYVGWFLDESADPVEFAARVRAGIAPLTDAQVLRNGHWVIVTHADFGKGTVLREAARGLGLARDRILALGDQPNDLDMLDGVSAAYVGCPASADPEVQRTVRSAGGWVADAPGPAGSAQLIRRFAEAVLG